MYFKHARIQKKYVMLQMEDYQGGGAKYRREFERFYSCDVL